MTLLATRLSEQHGLGLLTDTGAMDSLATVARLDAYHHFGPRPRWSRMRYAGRGENTEVPHMLAEGLLAHLVLERLELDPTTPVERIIKFRDQHADELGRFRTSIGELTASISGNQPINRIQQQVGDLYKNEVKPAIQEVRRALKGSKIKHVAENFLKVSCFSFGSTSLPQNLLGMAAPYALLAGIGISVSVSTVLYNVDKR